MTLGVTAVLCSNNRRNVWFCVFSLEVKQLLQAKVDLQRELESVKEGEKERREREEALR